MIKRVLITVTLIASHFIVHAQEDRYKLYPMWDYKLPIEKRVNDLISRLTLEEKVDQMLNETPAVKRLGIPAYDWWNEILHGVARTSFNVTVYPQAIGMAATWDTNSLYRMADYSALEGRVIFRNGKEGARYNGLTYWTPNINIFRDPRWGRGQETYGEDPFLTAMIAKSFVRGLQGEDPKYLKAAACAKHFAVHSGPEPTRHSDNFNPSAHDLWDTYLPAFRELIVNAKVAGVMCAYNAINTQPCCANDLLMNDILRKQWKFTGYVTSDCWAVDDFFRYHKTHKDATSSAVDALIHGTDVECGRTVYKTLLDAVKTGLIKEDQLDVSLRRLFTIRYRLGMFDPPSMVKYAQVPDSTLESSAHKAHSLKMAQQSIVLLKNQNNILPLSKKIKRIAVVGPNADNAIAVLGNYNGTPSSIVTPLQGIKDKLGANAEVIYEKAINFTNDTIFVAEDISKQISWEGKPGFLAEYKRQNIKQSHPDVSQMELQLDHAWSDNEKIGDQIQAKQFEAVYKTHFSPAKNGPVSFELQGNEGYKFYINDKVVIDSWERNRWGTKTYTLQANKDSVYKLVVEYYQQKGKPSIRLRAGQLKPNNINEVINRVSNADAIIFVGGISPQLEGEEMKVNYPGFNGGDRTSILLPGIQTDFMKKLKATGKPVVFVMMTGSAIATPWESENIPGILNAWYGGQSAGTAIADVLFGDYNPAGRLPVTFYKSDGDLPSFDNYDMSNRTYRYFKGEALYPFGYGLSYTSFKYDNLVIPATVKKGNGLSVNVKVTNTGNKDGEEVVQLYVSHQDKDLIIPVRALKGFKRISLKAHESKTISFKLTSQDLSLVNNDGELIQTAEKIDISVGGGQPVKTVQASGNVLTKTIKVL